MLFKHKVDSDINLVFLHESLAEILFELVDKDREYLGKWMPWVDETKSAEDIKQWIARDLVRYAEGKGITCAIEFAEQIVGVISYNRIEPALRKVVIGYWLASEYQGQGIMTRACQHLINHAFEDFQVQKVEIAAATENFPSRNVCERLGLKLEGVITNAERVNDYIYDHAVYGIKNSMK